MDLRTEARPVEAVSLSKRRSTAPTPTHQAPLLEGATLTGEAATEQHGLRIGLWLDEAGRVKQARWRAIPSNDETALRDCADALCTLLERMGDPRAFDAEAVQRALIAHSTLAEHAALVAGALEAALVV